MAAMIVDSVADEVLGGIRARGTYRRMRVLEGAQGPRMTVDGREVLLFGRKQLPRPGPSRSGGGGIG